jgi:hypothetical protein
MLCIDSARVHAQAWFSLAEPRPYFRAGVLGIAGPSLGCLGAPAAHAETGSCVMETEESQPEVDVTLHDGHADVAPFVWFWDGERWTGPELPDLHPRDRPRDD